MIRDHPRLIVLVCNKMSMIDEDTLLKELVNKYTVSFPSFTPFTPPNISNRQPGAVVLLSGSTGVYGTNILAELSKSSFFRRAYAVSRPSANGITVRERHVQAFKREGIDEALLDNPKIRFLDADLSIEGFGMDAELFSELQSTVTHIIHNGWQVKFNIPVKEFEENFRGVRNLVDFSLHSRDDPSDPEKIWPEELFEESDSALSTGYSQAKWVSERILAEAAKNTALRPTVVRVGQLVGGPDGNWSEHEWFAALIKTSITLGMLPNVPGVIAWNTTHVAARALLDILDSDELCLNVDHPKPIAWETFITIFARKLELRIVNMEMWMGAVEREYQLAIARAVQPDGTLSREIMRRTMKLFPALRMHAFFRSARDTSRGKPLGPGSHMSFTPRAHTEKAVKASATLRDAKLSQIGEEDVGRWLAYWRRIGFLDATHLSEKSLL
ncbi:hypothetical protein EW145_g1561 [Phellinidium pouzarii]|uniref:Thioester reductase (TE) domain-containing protein n=1 Tax=Phellinidium pouzarii TaxID=167371 RepID=A0A4S4LJN8_9AGAM|nr:hypothetical protein EW145_g1561 [Phellinidium pouzarii]